MYINAYLDENRYSKLEYLTQITHASISDVVKQAIDFYYERSKRTKTSAEILLHSGFVGCGEAEPTLSENYKSEIYDLMEKKHDNG